MFLNVKHFNIFTVLRLKTRKKKKAQQLRIVDIPIYINPILHCCIFNTTLDIWSRANFFFLRSKLIETNDRALNHCLKVKTLSKHHGRDLLH